MQTSNRNPMTYQDGSGQEQTVPLIARQNDLHMVCYRREEGESVSGRLSGAEWMRAFYQSGLLSDIEYEQETNYGLDLAEIETDRLFAVYGDRIGEETPIRVDTKHLIPESVYTVFDQLTPKELFTLLERVDEIDYGVGKQYHIKEAVEEEARQHFDAETTRQHTQILCNYLENTIPQFAELATERANELLHLSDTDIADLTVAGPER